MHIFLDICEPRGYDISEIFEMVVEILVLCIR